MGIQSAVYSWPSVKGLCRIVFSMNFAGTAALLLAALWALRFDRGFGEYLSLVSAGDGRLWTTVIIVAVFLCAPAYALGLKSYAAFSRASHEVDDNCDGQPLNRLLFSHALACVVSGILVAVLNVACLVRASSLQQKDRDALMEAIENYGSDVVAKTRVDAVQTSLECCGDESYRDWFRVSWLRVPMEVGEEAEAGPRLEGQSMSDAPVDGPTTMDVPFSCCSNDVLKPCVHHDILNPSVVYEYDPKRLTIATIVLSLLARLLQTAHGNEMYIGPEKSRYSVWIFTRPSAHRNEALLRQEAAGSSSGERGRSKGASISTQFSDTSEDEAVHYIGRRKRRIGKATLLRKIGSKVASVKCRSLPFVGSSVKFSLKESRSDKGSDANRRYVKEPWDVVPRNYAEEEDESESPTTVDLLPPLPPPPFFQSFLQTPKIGSRASRKLLAKNSDEKNRSNASDSTSTSGETPAKQSSSRGNRRRVLAKFRELSGSKGEMREPREGGGADDTSGEERSGKSRRRLLSSLDTTDIYDRFRGTLQHTLARREATKSRGRRGTKPSSRVYSPRLYPNVDTRRGSLLARLRRNDVPPSYRLLANFEIQKRVAPGPHKSAAAPAPPSPPPPPPSENPWPRDSSHASRIRSLESRCSVCNRAVRRSPIDRHEDPTDSATLSSREMRTREGEEA